jgi:hypothetical protein
MYHRKAEYRTTDSFTQIEVKEEPNDQSDLNKDGYEDRIFRLSAV